MGEFFAYDFNVLVKKRQLFASFFQKAFIHADVRGFESPPSHQSTAAKALFKGLSGDFFYSAG